LFEGRKLSKNEMYYDRVLSQLVKLTSEQPTEQLESDQKTLKVSIHSFPG